MIRDYFNGLRQLLILNGKIVSFEVVKEVFANKDGFIRVKCLFTNGNLFEFAEYVQIGQKRKVIHHRELSTFPHHLHDGNNICEAKPATLIAVLKEIARYP